MGKVSKVNILGEDRSGEFLELEVLIDDIPYKGKVRKSTRLMTPPFIYKHQNQIIELIGENKFKAMCSLKVESDFIID